MMTDHWDFCLFVLLHDHVCVCNMSKFSFFRSFLISSAPEKKTGSRNCRKISLCSIETKRNRAEKSFQKRLRIDLSALSTSEAHAFLFLRFEWFSEVCCSFLLLSFLFLLLFALLCFMVLLCFSCKKSLLKSFC